MPAIQSIYHRFRGVSNPEEFGYIFDYDFSVELAKEAKSSSSGHEREDYINTINLFLRFKFPTFVRSSIKAWVVASFCDLDKELGVQHAFPIRLNCLASKLRALKTLRWHKLYHNHCLEAIQYIVECKADMICREASYDEKVLPMVFEWLQGTLKPFLLTALEWAEDKQTSQHVHKIAVEAIIQRRCRELFEIVTDFPDSLPSLAELREQMDPVSLSYIGKTLRKAIETRLLHLGASTSQILDFYMNMIKALRVLDSTDSLLNYIAEPVRSYLKNRKDTIRCVISYLIDSKDSDLHSALKKGTSLAYGIDEDDEEWGEGYDHTPWQPRRRHKELDFSQQTRGLDILATLVSIYLSTELFIVEYRQLLSEKLLGSLSYAIDEEVANIELLKIRFGEDSLHSCEVMLKDMQDSKRTNTAVHAALTKERRSSAGQRVDFAIISEQYWPSLPRNSSATAYHSKIESMLKEYSKAYEVLKKPRGVAWAHDLGQVEVELEFGEGAERVVRSFACSTVQANLITYLEEGGEMTVERLGEEAGYEEGEVVGGMRYWVGKGVVRESSRKENGEIVKLYTVIEKQGKREDKEDEGGGEEEEAEDKLEALRSTRLLQAKQLVEDFIKGLLTSHGAMGVDRLCSLLQLILQANASQQVNTSDCAFATSIASLRQFLQALVDKGALEVVDGLYSLHKG